MIPELFKDRVFQRSSHWVLSTSAVFSTHFPVYGWGEVFKKKLYSYVALICYQVVPDGFGVAYMTGYEGENYSKKR